MDRRQFLATLVALAMTPVAARAGASPADVFEAPPTTTYTGAVQHLTRDQINEVLESILKEYLFEPNTPEIRAEITEKLMCVLGPHHILVETVFLEDRPTDITVKVSPPFEHIAFEARITSDPARLGVTPVDATIEPPAFQPTFAGQAVSRGIRAAVDVADIRDLAFPDHPRIPTMPVEFDGPPPKVEHRPGPFEPAYWRSTTP